MVTGEIQGSLILLRGLPGSGKSTLAASLSENGKYPVTSIDSYFINEKGEYIFNYLENHLAYKHCEQETEKFLSEKHEKVFVDNTFTLDWEMEPYFKLAARYGYRLHVMTVENYHNGKNIHAIPEEQVRRMAEKYRVRLMP
jgi:predicted kinase